MFDEDKEPMDIFAGVDPVSNAVPSGASNQPDSGVSPRNRVVRSGPPRWLFGIIALLILGGLGGGGYYLFFLRGAGSEIAKTPPAANQPTPSQGEQPTMPADVTEEPVDAAMPDEASDMTVEEPDVPVIETETQPEVMPETPVPVEPPATIPPNLKPPVIPPVTPVTDSDGDGLSDEREAALGTDIVNPDTDADGLTDGEEVNVYKTDPLMPDTDGDSYLDGEEVRGGYNPNGAGRLLDLPTTP